jgi:MFS family permease
MPDSHDTIKLEGNLRRFIFFRLLYSARFYYPVFTVLFLDYGLTLEQFAILNIVWALTIVGAEVPSGALADIVGRKRLVVFAAVLMVCEMTLIAFAPIAGFGAEADSSLLFWLFFGNRVCSGLSEAAASGADEALAYDSLKALGREGEWAHYLERLTRVVSVGFFVSMIFGGLVYDAAVVNGALGALDPSLSLAQTSVIRLPVILTLVSAVIVLTIALGFYDIDKVRLRAQRENQAAEAGLAARLAEPFKQIATAGRWTVNHRFVLFVILAALVLDSVARQFVVLASEYYRVIDIPVSLFGFIGAGISLVNIFVARLSRYLVTHKTPMTTLFSLSAMLLCGLSGAALVLPWVGLVFALATFAVLGMVQFQSSYYLNRMVASDIRATVLSFRGLALNLGLGVASLFYTALVARYRLELPEGSEEEVFASALPAFPLYFIALLSLLVLGSLVLVKDRAPFNTVGGGVTQNEGNAEEDGSAGTN